MAKLGEGDPRWLVAERQDGKNVNNWHWSEKSIYSWAKTELEKMMVNQPIFEDNQAKIWINRLDSLKGDIIVSNRKGRNKFIWDLNVTVVWTATLKPAADDPIAAIDQSDAANIANVAPKTELSGKIECFNVNAVDDDYDQKCTIDDASSAMSQGSSVFSLIKKHGPISVMTIFRSLISKMTQEYKDAGRPELESSALTSSKSSFEPVLTTIMLPSSKLKVRPLRQVVTFQVPSQVLFETLLDPSRVSAFTGSAAQINDQVGCRFELFGGNVCGTNEEIVPGSKIVQKWRFSTWPTHHYSDVTLTFEQTGSSECKLELYQLNVPESDWERTSQGWQEHFWRRIRGVFGWSYNMESFTKSQGACRLVDSQIVGHDHNNFRHSSTPLFRIDRFGVMSIEEQAVNFQPNECSRDGENKKPCLDSWLDLMEYATNSELETMFSRFLDNPIFADVPKDVTLSELDHLIGLEKGECFRVYIERFDKQRIDTIVRFNTTVRALKISLIRRLERLIQGEIKETSSTTCPKRISFYSIWNKYNLAFNGTHLQDSMTMEELQIGDGAIIYFARKIRPNSSSAKTRIAR